MIIWIKFDWIVKEYLPNYLIMINFHTQSQMLLQSLKNFTMNLLMSLSCLTFSNLFLSISKTSFASIIVMLKRFAQIKNTHDGD